MKRIVLLITLVLSVLPLRGQMLEPVKFSSRLEVAEGASEGKIVFSGSIQRGWHVYSTELGAAGPTEASFQADAMEGVELVGGLKAIGKEIEHFDPVFEQDLRYFEGTVVFVQELRFTSPDYKLEGYLEYGACNDENCLPPQRVEVLVTPDTDRVPHGMPGGAGHDEGVAGKDTPVSPGSDRGGREENHGLLYLLVMGFLGGLLAILMPCIWPIIPMTVSFFMHRGGSRKDSVRDAILYGVSIIVIYLVLGLALTLIFGGNKLNELSTNAVFNIFLFVLLVVFALSFFGWFEIRLPSSWNNAVDSKASRTTGLLSIFLMAFTLVLVSFSCTAPIIGLLLAQMSTTGEVLGPIFGMFGFAFAFALVFGLFALFPDFMKRLPKSGSWMTKIQVVLAFVELAFAFKFLSVADLAYGWHILDREVFLSIWIVIFALLGAYLVGWLKFPVDEIGGNLNKPSSVPSIMLGMCSFALAIYMLPGLWGAPCKAVSAFAPPLYTQEFNLNKSEVRAKYLDYEAGFAAAKAEGKPVLLDFTGYGCVNCRKIEAQVWTDATVARMLNQDYVLVSLYVDDKTPLPEPIIITENGRELKLRTVGDKWSYLQRTQFGSNAQPYYIAVSPSGEPLTSSYGYDKSIANYVRFLESGLAAWRSTK